MNGGDSDTDLILYRWIDEGFVEQERLPVPGGEDASVFAIDGQTFLATASVRTGGGPYKCNAVSRIFRHHDDAWRPFRTSRPSPPEHEAGARQWCPVVR